MNPLDPDTALCTAWLISPVTGEASALVAAGDDFVLVTQLAGIAFAKLDQAMLVGIRERETGDWLATIGYLGVPDPPVVEVADAGETFEIAPSVEEGPA